MSPLLRTFLLVVALGLTSCDFLKAQLPALPSADWTKVGLPTRNGNGVLIEIGGSRLELSPTLDDAITRLGACTDAITYCYAPGTNELDACVSGVTVCDATLNPAGCCPQACLSAYSAARASGAGDFEAFDTTFFRDSGCFPGVLPLLQGPP